MHIHENAAEAFYVFDGEYVLFIEELEYFCPAGSLIYIPRRDRAQLQGRQEGQP